MRMKTDNKKKSHDLKVLEGKEEANRWNEARKTIACGMTAGLQPWTSICKDRDNNLIGNDQLIMDKQKD
jgi:hypothetical protein